MLFGLCLLFELLEGRTGTSSLVSCLLLLSLLLLLLCKHQQAFLEDS
jgi:hypothetical protein